MRRGLTICALCLGSLLPTGCQDDDGGSPFPSMWNEIACLATDGEGRISHLVTDAGDTYEVTNRLTGYRPDTLYRVMCGYTTESGQATLYQTAGVHTLRDSSACATHDPVSTIAVWRSGSYINLHLAPLTQGGTHAWGFATDSIGPGGHRYLSLHHRQGSDPLSYTQETYASIALADIAGLAEGDSLSLSIHTFKGIKTWNFKR